MSQASQANSTFSLPSDTQILHTHTFDAPRDLVWRVSTDPAFIPRWWGPAVLTTRVDRFDFRPGGGWRFVQTASDGGEFAFHGEYREIEAPSRSVATFEFEGMPGHVIIEETTLSEIDGKTTLTVLSTFMSQADRDGMRAYGMEEGAAESMERLAALIAQQA